MNHVVITGKIVGDIKFTLSEGSNITSFTVKNLYYKSGRSTQQVTLVRCIAYGALADYVNNEMYEGCNVIVTGRVCYRRIEANNTVINQLFVGCNTVSVLDQEEYI